MTEMESDDEAKTRAKDIFRQVITLNPKHIESLVKLGEFYMPIKSSIAEDYFSKALEIDNDSAPVLHSMLIIKSGTSKTGGKISSANARIFEAFVTKHQSSI